MPRKDEDDEYYFSLFKIKEVTKGIEEGNTSKKKELMIILRCKNKAANYAIYYDLNNKVEHKLRMSVYVFDKEGCMYPDKTASKTPLNITVLNEMFKANTTISRPKYVDNKLNRREVVRTQTRERINEDGYPKEIKMGEIQLPPYLWFAEEPSTPDPKGLAAEINVQPSTSRGIQHNSTPDPWQRGLAGEDSHTNINALLLTNNSQDRRSILIDGNTEIGEIRTIINENTYKPSVFDRLGSAKINPNTTNKSGIDQQDPKQKGKQTNSLYNHQVNQHGSNRNQARQH